MMTGHDIDQRRAELRARRNELIVRSGRVDRDLARQNEPLVADFADQAVQRQNDETLAAIGASAQQEIQAIDRALARLEEGAYGICVNCGRSIEPARLRAVAYAVTCGQCSHAQA